jgi:hypothetical protein
MFGTADDGQADPTSNFQGVESLACQAAAGNIGAQSTYPGNFKALLLCSLV